MYLPAHFEENDPAVLRAFIDRHPLATLVTRDGSGLNANHIPMLIETLTMPLIYGRCSAAIRAMR